MKKYRELSDVLIMLGGMMAGVSCMLSTRLYRNVDNVPFWVPLIFAALFYTGHVISRRAERVRRIRVRLVDIPEDRLHAFNCSWHQNRVCNLKCSDK